MVRGRPPKPDEQKVTRVPLQHQWTDVLDVPFEPPRDQRACPVRPAPAETQRWWKAISTMPHCYLWGAGEWELARMTARLHAKAWESGQGGREVERRERLLGTTEDARKALRIRYVQAGTEPQPVFEEAEGTEDEAAPISFVDERRKLLGG